MSRRPWFRAPLAAVTALALVGLVSCSSGDDGGDVTATTAVTIPFEFSGTAATVNGTAIPAQAVGDQIAIFREVPEAVSAALGDVPDLLQPGTDQPQPVVVADLLQTEIMVNLIQAELAEEGITPSADDVRIAGNNLAAAFGTSLDKLPASYVDTLTQRYAEYIALDVFLNPAPPEEELLAAYAAEPQKWERSCARHILVTSDEDAESVLAQLRAGADFATVATARSLDSGTAPLGGDLGCLARGETGGAFEAALWDGPVGELQGPITTEVGIHIVEVLTRGVPPFEEARESILLDKRAEPFAQLGAWVTVRAVRSDITVDPRFGTWEPSVGQVQPKGGTPDGLTLTPGPGGPATTQPATTVTTAGVGVPTTGG